MLFPYISLFVIYIWIVKMHYIPNEMKDFTIQTAVLWILAIKQVFEKKKTSRRIWKFTISSGISLHTYLLHCYVHFSLVAINVALCAFIWVWYSVYLLSYTFNQPLGLLHVMHLQYMFSCCLNEKYIEFYHCVSLLLFWWFAMPIAKSSINKSVYYIYPLTWLL